MRRYAVQIQFRMTSQSKNLYFVGVALPFFYKIGQKKKNLTYHTHTFRKRRIPHRNWRDELLLSLSQENHGEEELHYTMFSAALSRLPASSTGCGNGNGNGKATAALQSGQVHLTRSHLVTQALWNKCLHAGRTLQASPAS